MLGWNTRSGDIIKQNLSEDELWMLFNFVFSDSSKKRSTYKFGLIKSILDNLFNTERDDYSLFISYENLFSKFAENYWNLVVKYELRQIRADGKSSVSKLEKIFFVEIERNPEIRNIPFNSISEGAKKRIIKNVSNECRTNVLGALYKDLGSSVYAFDLSGTGIFINAYAFNFMMKYKIDLEKLNYYAWAKFLEEINDDDVLNRILDKLEFATPQRKDLSLFREVLRKEFENDCCFYCGSKLRETHVDHFIPWSFVKEDKLWNFVLSCPKCNIKKSDKLAPERFLNQIQDRNTLMLKSKNNFVQKEFLSYQTNILSEMWNYARTGGFEVIKIEV